MSIYVYDGSFEGLLSVVFQCFASKRYPVNIVREECYQPGLLDDVYSIQSSEEYAERVLQGLDRQSEGRGALLVYKMFLSGLAEIEMTIFRFVKTVMDSRKNPLGNYANPDIAEALRIEKMIRREVHRMHAFVRFKKFRDGIFCALINPDFNVLPLIGKHFEKRYTDQPWIIVDSLRHYALYYDLTSTHFIGLDHPLLAHRFNSAEGAGFDGEEDQYQQLWVSYFNSVTIQERKNPKLHLRHMPRRYWRYLVEKAPTKTRNS